MNFLGRILPGWVPWAAIGGLVLLLGATGLLLRGAWQANGALKVQLANEKAVNAQMVKDRETSAQEIARLQGRIIQIDSTAAPVRERIIHVPTTRLDDPALQHATDGVRELLLGSGGPPAGR